MAAATAHESLDDLLDSFELTLRAEKKSPRTIKNYASSTRLLDDFMAGRRVRRHVLDATRPDISAFVADQLERHSASTAATRFRCIQQFYRWAVREDYLEVSPMDSMTPPTLDEKVVPIIPDKDLRALLKGCDGTKRFDDVRDRALILFLIDTGARLGETTGLGVDDVTPKSQQVIVHGKGDRSRRVYFSANTAVALNRYERQRRNHTWAGSPSYWLGVRGPLTDSGLTQMLRRRSTDAGIRHIHPHMFRHTWAHLMKVHGMADDEVMELGGWRTPQMLNRYGSSARAERAKATYQKFAPGDQL